MPKRSLKLRELLKRLKPYGVISLKQRGKGSERILAKPVENTENPPGKQKVTKGPQYPIKDHGEGTEISIPVINAVLRRFDINEDDFWD